MPRVLLPSVPEAKTMPVITHRISLASLSDLPNFPFSTTLAPASLSQKTNNAPSSLKRKSMYDQVGAPGHAKRHSFGNIAPENYYRSPLGSPPFSLGDVPPPSTHRSPTYHPLTMLSELAISSGPPIPPFKHHPSGRRASTSMVSENKHSHLDRSPYLDQTGNGHHAHHGQKSAPENDRPHHPKNSSVPTATCTSPYRRRSSSGDIASFSPSFSSSEISSMERPVGRSPPLTSSSSQALAEENRRNNINRIFETLRETVANSTTKGVDDKTKDRDLTKWDILTRAIECITELKRSESNWIRERDRLQAEITTLKQKNAPAM